MLRENYLSKIFQEHSKETFPGLLILLGPISGIVEYTTETKRNGHFLSISSIMEQMDKILGLSGSIVSVSCKLSEESKEIFDSEKVRNYNLEI